MVREIKRLYPETVTGEIKGLLSLIPERESEHPVEALEAANSLLPVAVEEELCVTPALGAHPRPSRPGTERLKVIEFTIVDEPLCSVRTHERLVTRGAQIHDRESPVGETNSAAISSMFEKACVIGTARGEALSRSKEHAPLNERARTDIAKDATHPCCLCASSPRPEAGGADVDLQRRRR